jgi:outer membrane protein OmpA-like peptidoglycan-associated protein/tetratricopeptide (TPR) repeat protein
MNRFLTLLIFGSLLISLNSCDLVKDFTYTVNPDPLEMHGDSLRFNVIVNIPEKGIQKKIRAEISPKIGNTSIGTWIVQGEKVTGNGKTVLFKPGGTVNFEMAIPYSNDMEAADFKITGKVFKGLKEKMTLPEKKIADATIVTPLLVKKEFKMIYEDDAIIRSVDKTKSAVINFDRGQSIVKASELKDVDLNDLLVWISTSQLNPKIKINSIDIVGYASPDGVEDKNSNLSNERTQTARASLISLMKKAKIVGYSDTTNYTMQGKGEDFDGFKEQLSLTTSISEADKNLFIRILEMTKDPVQRETEMINLGKSYTELEKDVFPKIRRANIIVNYTENGLTDDEILQATINNPSILGVEELLFAAKNLTQDLNEKARIYQLAASNFDSDYRTHNNLGALNFSQNKIADAKKSLEKSNSLKENIAAKNNLAGVVLIQDNRTQAIKLMTQTKSVDAKNSSIVAYNNAILNIMSGNYSKAENNLKDDSFNKALALTLQGKLPQATKVLSAVATTSESLYLKAIISARSGESVDAVVTNLKQAFAKDSNLKTKASKDREFLKFMNDAIFTAAVN